MSASGSIVWPSPSEPLWQLNWHLADSPDAEGIVISGASYKRHKVFHKASLPSLRVQYDGNVCGPYKDPLNFNDSVPADPCPASNVCIYTYTSNGFRALHIGSLFRIGNYRLYQRWVFWEHGHVYPRLFSAGLQCNANHRHHVYWRLDFDIDGAANDLVLEYNRGNPDIGWGPGWHLKTAEIARVKNPPTDRHWAVLDKQLQRGYNIVPGEQDGVADSFSNYDLWVLLYHPNEDLNGRQGDAYSDGLQPYLNGENVDGQDVVVWYCSHLSHEANTSQDEWHIAGPNLFPFGNWG